MLKNDFEPKYFKFINQRKDRYRHVFSRGGKPVYHLYKYCIALKRSFIDYSVPFITKDKDKLTNEEVKLVNDFRKWFIKNDFRYKLKSGNISMETLVYKYNTSFAVRNNLETLDSSYSFNREIVNSGFLEVETSFDLDRFKNEIDGMLFVSFTMGYDKILRKLRKFDWMRKLPKEELYSKLELHFEKDFLVSYGEDNIRDFMKRHYNLREQAFNKVLNYLKWNFGLKNKEFDKVKLEHFGFKLHSNCEITSVAF